MFKTVCCDQLDMGLTERGAAQTGYGWLLLSFSWSSVCAYQQHMSIVHECLSAGPEKREQ
jgi:hypothetical protein